MFNKRVKIIGHNVPIMKMLRDNRSRRYMPMINDIFNRPDIVLFTGGADVHPKFYNEPLLSSTNYNDLRDQTDLEAFEKYLDLPKVGICRGGQFLNVMNGGALWQHVNNHAIGGRHKLINLLPTSTRDMGDEIEVTSTHHQMMIPAEDGEVLGITTDDTGYKGLATVYQSGTKREKPKFDTEVVWYEKTKSLCFQPHPEFQVKTDGETYFFDLLDHFFKD